MIGDVGIGIAAQRGSMEEASWSWDSRKKKMAIDLKSKPPHLDLVLIDGGTVWSVAAGEKKEEVIFEIEHKMPFRPQVLSYFYCYDAPASHASLLGTHSQGVAMMVFNDVVTGSEWLVAEVDDKYFRIIHKASGGLNGGALIGKAMKYRLRYEITNLKYISPRGSQFF